MSEPNINKGQLIKPEEVQKIKQKIKAELERRKVNDSNLTNYANAINVNVPVIKKTEEYTLIQPKEVEDLFLGTKAIIEDETIQVPKQTEIIENLTSLLEKINNQLNRPFTEPSDCGLNCAGLCQTSCITECSKGCGGNCTGGCTGSCKGGCSSCSGCSGGCSGCTSSCGGCTDSCSGGCSGCGNCGSSCRGGCSGDCGSSCVQLLMPGNYG